MSDAHEDRRDRPTPAGRPGRASDEARPERPPTDAVGPVDAGRAVGAVDVSDPSTAAGVSAAPEGTGGSRGSGGSGSSGGSAAADGSDADVPGAPEASSGPEVPEAPEAPAAESGERPGDGETGDATVEESSVGGASVDGPSAEESSVGEASDEEASVGAEETWSARVEGGGTGNADADGGDRADRGGSWSDLDEDDVRRLLHFAVRDLEPDDGSLERLRDAVPARRQRRRQLVMGAVAALVVVGASVPVAVRVAPDLGADDRRAETASSQRAPQGTGAQADGGTGAESRGPGKDGHGTDGSSPHGRGSSGTSRAGSAPTPAGNGDVTSPTCGRDQLGQATSTLQPAEADGRIYGRFRVVNTSGAPCTVQGGGTVSAVAEGSARATGIQVVDHTAGDTASGLPDPTAAPDQLVLQPGQAYEVKFAWVPQSGGGISGCGTAPGTPSGAPAPTSSSGTESDSSQTASGDAGGSQAGGDNGSGDTPASVRLSHTPEAGEPAAVNATLPDACAGTLYRTGALPAS